MLLQSIQVRVGTLDQFCRREGVDRIHLLKMDVQGGEGLVIEGATGMLSRGRIDAIYTEVMFVSHYAEGKLFDELSGMLERHGLRLFGFYNLTWATNGQLRFGDALYVSDGVREQVFNRLPEEP